MAARRPGSLASTGCQRASSRAPSSTAILASQSALPRRAPPRGRRARAQAGSAASARPAHPVAGLPAICWPDCGQAVELAAHHLAAADGAVQHALVEDAPELGGTRSVQNCLTGQPGGYLLVEIVEVPAGAGAEDRAGVVFGLQQAGDDERLVPAQDRGLGFDAGPLLEPAIQALLLALATSSSRPDADECRAAGRLGRYCGEVRRGGDMARSVSDCGGSGDARSGWVGEQPVQDLGALAGVG